MQNIQPTLDDQDQNPPILKRQVRQAQQQQQPQGQQSQGQQNQGGQSSSQPYCKICNMKHSATDRCMIPSSNFMTKSYKAGLPYYNDCVIKTFKVKKSDKPEDIIKQGDPVSLCKNKKDCCVLEKGTKENLKKSALVGFATVGIHGFSAPVVLEGHIIVHIDTELFATPVIGECLKLKEDNSICPRFKIIKKFKGLNALGNQKNMVDLHVIRIGG